MPGQSKILVVDDERPMREMLRLGLERQGYVVQDLPDGRGLQDVVVQWQPDAIILDVMMPFADGFALLPMIRRTTQAPVIMLTAKGDVGDRVTGLGLGADDYVSKPFAFEELVGRIEAALRRPHISAPAFLRFRDLTVNLKTREVERGGHPVALTNKEFALLVALMREPRRVFSKEELLSQVWGEDFDGEVGNVETYISYLRAKVDTDPAQRLIHTIRGAGYSLRSES
ncbi:MAG: response regulator transcription factor [Candidatus Eremiobacteraeota bacterium]|nr:response regulator transcription factor [Candidatus Eremiobacteraeota bacterium]MBV8667780.1 response regulator transcription factor [Candidatus Eremiobacteraeota bacterium]